MKTVKSSRGPLQSRPYYELHEIERICNDELRAMELLPTEPAPIRIDRLIEKKFGNGVLEYRDLPEGIWGFSQFGTRGVETIAVAKSLDQESSTSSKRLLRSTLAHEVGHVLLQGYLFVLGAKPSHLFNDGIAEPKILCRSNNDVSASRSYNGEWWEFQANQAIGSLLMPQDLVKQAISHLLTKVGLLGLETLDSAQRATATTILADSFDVNPAAAKFRIDLLYPAAKGQLTL